MADKDPMALARQSVALLLIVLVAACARPAQETEAPARSRAAEPQRVEPETALVPLPVPTPASGSAPTPTPAPAPAPEVIETETLQILVDRMRFRMEVLAEDVRQTAWFARSKDPVALLPLIQAKIDQLVVDRDQLAAARVDGNEESLRQWIAELDEGLERVRADLEDLGAGGQPRRRRRRKRVDVAFWDVPINSHFFH